MKDLSADFIKVDNALTRLEESILESVEVNSLAIDGTIQRFEFSFELIWKLCKKIFLNLDTQLHAPREILQKAYEFKWLEDEQLWLEMLRCRNETSHIYDEARAAEIYQRIKVFSPVMRSTYETLKEKYDSNFTYS